MNRERFELSYKDNEIYQTNIVVAESAEQASQWFKENHSGDIIGCTKAPTEVKPGQPVSVVPPDWVPLGKVFDHSNSKQIGRYELIECTAVAASIGDKEKDRQKVILCYDRGAEFDNADNILYGYELDWIKTPKDLEKAFADEGSWSSDQDDLSTVLIRGHRINEFVWNKTLTDDELERMEKPSKTFWHVKYRNIGDERCQNAWFDNREEADEFRLSCDAADDPERHTFRNPDVIQEYENIVAEQKNFRNAVCVSADLDEEEQSESRSR